MPYQEMFDKVLTKIRERGYTQALTEYEGCTRCTFCNSSGVQCSLGILVDAKLDDKREDYADRMWDGVWKAVFSLFEVEEYKGLPPFAVDLREAHNYSLSFGPGAFELRMGRIAEVYNLVYSPLPSG